MEEIILKEEQLKELANQYFELKQTIKEYRNGMRSRKYRAFSPEQKTRVKAQYTFFKHAINDTVRVLIDHNFHDAKLLEDAIRNRNVKFKNKIACIKALIKIPVTML